MRVVLGIDAAWTPTGSSGVALAEEFPSGWRLKSVEASYSNFLECSEDGRPQATRRGEPPDVSALLKACFRLCGHSPELVAVDMPLSNEKIVGPRCSDRVISSAFGARKAATYSPNAVRPGPVADKLREDFAGQGYKLCTASSIFTPGLIEVYPHAALLEMTGDIARLCYKDGKTKIYWPELKAMNDRRANLREVWKRIVEKLEIVIMDVEKKMPQPKTFDNPREWKAYEDRLDALVCAYVAIAALNGEARAYGDEVSAIWVPRGERLRSSPER